MNSQILILFIGCVILCFVGLINGNSYVTDDEEIKKKNQLYEDVYVLKQSIDTLRLDAKRLKQVSGDQVRVLEAIKSNIESNESNDVCERNSGFFNNTYRKFNMFEERIIFKLDEIQEEQTTNLNKILVRQNLSKNCQQGSALDIMSEALAEINEKIETFETKLKKFETLEQKLQEQADKYKALNDAQMNILKDISTKLTQNQLKFENFEKLMPNWKEITDKIDQLSTPKIAALPMSVILGVTQNKSKPAPAAA